MRDVAPSARRLFQERHFSVRKTNANALYEGRILYAHIVIYRPLEELVRPEIMYRELMIMVIIVVSQL